MERLFNTTIFKRFLRIGNRKNEDGKAFITPLRQFGPDHTIISDGMKLIPLGANLITPSSFRSHNDNFRIYDIKDVISYAMTVPTY